MFFFVYLYLYFYLNKNISEITSKWINRRIKIKKNEMHKPSYLFVCLFALVFICINVLNVQHITSTAIAIIRAMERWTVHCHAGAHGIVSWSLRNNVGGRTVQFTLESFRTLRKLYRDRPNVRRWNSQLFPVVFRNYNNISRNLQRKISSCKPTDN